MFSAVPGFITALVLIYFFAFKMQQWTGGSFYFPLRGGYSNTTLVDPTNLNFWLDVIWHSVLPAISMLLVSTGGWALGMRAMMVTVEGVGLHHVCRGQGIEGRAHLLALRYAQLYVAPGDVAGDAVGRYRLRGDAGGGDVQLSGHWVAAQCAPSLPSTTT